jgi:AraC-like DNA-binding protein
MYAQSVGLDGNALLASVGVDPALLNQLDAFVPLSAAGELFARLEAETGSPLVGLRSAEHVGPAAFDVFRYTGSTSQSVGDALTQFVRWFPMLNTASRARLAQVGSTVRLVCDAGPLELVRAPGAEYVIACTLRGFQDIAREPLIPLQIEFCHPRRGPPGEHERFFGCPISFEMGEDAIVFPSSVSAQPARQPDPTLNALLQRHLEELSRKVPRTERVVDQVEGAIIAELGKGQPTMTEIARHLGLSSRSLQRRLAEEGTTFREVLQRVRERLARSYLRAPGVTIAEVAFLLGFADVPTFHRAFRGWTGKTPGDYSS